MGACINHDLGGLLYLRRVLHVGIGYRHHSCMLHCTSGHEKPALHTIKQPSYLNSEVPNAVNSAVNNEVNSEANRVVIW